MTIHLPTLTQLFALAGCLTLGALLGTLVLTVSVLLDRSLDLWFSNEVMLPLRLPVVLAGAAGGAWFWVAVLL